jgi:RNA polymerase sigma factor (TIGR02999 family)
MTSTIDADSNDAADLGRTDVDAAVGRDALFAQVYDRLKAMASRQLASRSGATLQTTALVHELYLRVGHGRELSFQHPAQFFAYAARAMRHLLNDRARDRMRLRAGGAWVSVTLDGADMRLAIDSAEEAMAVEDALVLLERSNPRAARVVELRYFAGLSLEQSADAMGVARSTIDRDWRFARAFLHARLA